jgi:hypothetical protein
MNSLNLHDLCEDPHLQSPLEVLGFRKSIYDLVAGGGGKPHDLAHKSGCA